MRGIATDNREIMAALCHAVERFHFLHKNSDQFAVPRGIVVSGGGGVWLCYRLQFPHMASGNILEIELHITNNPSGCCRYELDVGVRLPDSGASGGFSHSFSVWVFSDMNRLCLKQQIEAGSDLSEQIDSILHEASSVLTHQCEFSLLDDTLVWLSGSSLQESMTDETLESLLQRNYVWCSDVHRKTLFTRVIAAGRFDLIDMHAVIDRFVAAGCDLDGVSDGYTPLAIAAQSGDVYVVNCLLSRGAKRLTPTVNYEGGAIHELLRRGLGPYWIR